MAQVIGQHMMHARRLAVVVAEVRACARLREFVLAECPGQRERGGGTETGRYWCWWGPGELAARLSSLA